MNFKKRKIRNHFRDLQKRESQNNSSDQEFSTKLSSPSRNNSSYIGVATIVAGIVLVLGLFWIMLSLVKSLDFGSVVFSFGKELKKDTARQTNFLLVGVGGAEHDGSNLTDTIIVASLNEKDHSVKMLSLPRDLYIDNEQTGGQRINKLYDTYLNKYDDSSQALDKLAEEITSITGIPIHYHVKVDFDGFVKIVDTLGGVTVDVEKRIYDPYYPRGETIYYETFVLEAGTQKLDGKTALKYARSRKTSSDFDRSRRQSQLLGAIKDQAASINLLTDPGKIQGLYNSVADSIETDLSVAEIIQLAKIAKDIPKENIQARVISDDFTSCGGFLYTPNRDYFGGAAVLLPAGNNFEEIKQFSQTYFNSKETATPEIQVLNGTKTSGLAFNYLNRLSRHCLNVVYYGNASNRDLENSTIFYNPIVDEKGNKKMPDSLSAIRQIIDAPIVEGIPEEYLEGEKRANTQIVLELGKDYQSITSADPFNKLLYTAPLNPPKTDQETDIVTGPEKPLNSTNSEASTSSSTDKADTEAASESTTQPLKQS